MSDARRALLDAVERARAVVAAGADEAERLRTLPAATVAVLRDTGLLGLKLPAVLGGAEADPVTQIEVIEALTTVDASAGWCLMVGATTGALPAVFLGDEAVAAMFAYIGLLFIMARVAERSPHGRRWANHPFTYALGLSVYCTTWTYYGSVGKAATGGMGYLPVYLGPTLALLVGGSVFRRIAALKHTHRITSIADFVSSRFAKSKAVAAAVTAILTVGIIPYIALQMKAANQTFTMLVAEIAPVLTS